MEGKWFQSSPTLARSIERALFLFEGQEEFLGSFDESKDKFMWKSRADTRKMVLSLYYSLSNANRGPVAICASNSPLWFICDMAISMSGLPAVGFHPSWNVEKIREVANRMELCTAYVDTEELANRLKEANIPTLKQITVFGSNEWKKILETPIPSDWTFHQLPLAEDNKKLFTVMFTSGTSGIPKGCAVSIERWRNDCAAGPFAGQDNPTIASHMALAHGGDRGLCWQALFAGAKIGFINANSHENLVHQIGCLRPTFLLAMSHFWSREYSRFNTTYQQKLAESPSCNPEWIKEDLIIETRETRFGGNILTQVTGGSLTPLSVLAWMKETFTTSTSSGDTGEDRVQDAYGTSEFPGISVNGEVNADVTLELVPVEEFGYSTSCGEIRVKNKNIPSGGYYKQPEETAKVWIDGWYHTGDIGTFKDGILCILDRKSNAIELYQDGDSIYINPSKIEGLFSTEVNSIKQILLVADRNQPRCLAIVVPEEKMKESKEEILQQMMKIATKHQLTFQEIPADIIIEKEEWTISNGKLNPLGKAARGFIVPVLKGKIDACYAAIEEIEENGVICKKFKEEEKIGHTNVFPGVPQIPQNTNVEDFLDFKFTGASDHISSLLESMKEDVKIIRSEFTRWTTESSNNAEKATKSASKQLEILNNQISFDSIVGSIEKINSAFPQSTEVSLLPIVQDFLCSLEERNRNVVSLFHQLSKILSSKHPEEKKIKNRYGKSLDALLVLAPREGIRVPYQIWASGWWVDPTSETVFDPTQLVAPLGKAEVYCHLSGELIEGDIKDVGKLRFHSLDRDDIDLTLDSRKNLLRLRKALDVAAELGINGTLTSLKNLNRVDPYWNDCWCLDFAHPWQHRTAIDKAEGHSDTPASVITRAWFEYANRPALGTFLTPSPLLEAAGMESRRFDSFWWVSYKQLQQLSSRIAKHLLSLCGPISPSNRAFIAISGYNNPTWLICEFACALIGAIPVGIHTTNTNQMTIDILNKIGCSILLCAETLVGWNVRDIPSCCPALRHVVYMDVFAESYLDNVQVHTLLNWVKEGQECDQELPNAEEVWSNDELYTLLFTSGTTSGVSKGVEVTVECFMNDISHRVFIQPLITTSFIPLSHSSDRLKIWEFLLGGGRIGFANYAHGNWKDHETSKKKEAIQSNVPSCTNGVEKLLHQIQLLSPSAISFPPRLWNGLKEYQSKNGLSDREIIEMFGSRIKFLVTGGAATPITTMKWIRELFADKNFSESYGCTEVGAITENGERMQGVEIRLDPIPGIEEGRGEIVVKTENMSRGYFNLPEETKKSFLPDGWYRTGDLGEWKNKKQSKLTVLGRI